ncbi:MAG: Ku protein [Asticcacaulis sp.]
MALRPYWSGNIRLSLVSLPVHVYPALNRSRQIAFHEIYKPTGERVRHQLVAGDKEVDRDDIVKGYEVEKGEYVLIDPDEIKDLKIPSSKTLDIAEFVDADAIDEVYFESPYFVAPAAKGDHATFAVIRDALRDEAKVGVGQLAIGGRERLCALKPYGSGLLLETLRYEDEIKDSDPYFDTIRDKKTDSEELDLARELIKRKVAKFDPGKFHDHYRAALQELIDARVEKREPCEVVESKPAAKVVNLMDALRQSLKQPEAANEDAPKKKTRRRKVG